MTRHLNSILRKIESMEDFRKEGVVWYRVVLEKDVFFTILETGKVRSGRVSTWWGSGEDPPPGW